MIIVFDIGGTKMRLAVSRDGETFEEPRIISTPQSFEEGIEAFKHHTHELARGEQITALAGGVRGPLDREKSQILTEIHLTDWVGKPLKERLESECGAPVYLENDSALVGLGEAVVGAGKDYPIVAYITVSTGVGGVRIVDGKIDESAIGFEPGKEIIDPDNSLCPECPGNTLEDYISGAAVEKRFGQKPYEIYDSEIWDEVAQFLAYGLHNTIVHWSPDAVVLGGSMVVKHQGISVAKVAEEVEGLLTVYPNVPPIISAELKDVGGLHGALIYAKQQNVRHPMSNI